MRNDWLVCESNQAPYTPYSNFNVRLHARYLSDYYPPSDESLESFACILTPLTLLFFE